MKLFNIILTFVITFTAFSSLAKSNGSIENNLACYQYSSHTNFLKQELSQVVFFVRANSESSIASNLDSDEKFLSTLLVNKKELKDREQRLNLTKTDLLKQIADLVSKNSTTSPSSQWRQPASTGGSDGLIQYLKIQVARIDSQLVGVANEQFSLEKRIEKLQKELSQANVETIEDSQVTKDRRAYFSQRAVEIQNELVKLQKVVLETCATNKK